MIFHRFHWIESIFVYNELFHFYWTKRMSISVNGTIISGFMWVIEVAKHMLLLMDWMNIQFIGNNIQFFIYICVHSTIFFAYACWSWCYCLHSSLCYTLSPSRSHTLSLSLYLSLSPSLCFFNARMCMCIIQNVIVILNSHGSCNFAYDRVCD